MELKKQWEPVVGGDAMHDGDKVIVKAIEADFAWVYSKDGYFTVSRNQLKQREQVKTEEEVLIADIVAAANDIYSHEHIAKALIKAGYKKC